MNNPMDSSGGETVDRHVMFREVMFARDRVYRLGSPTPIEEVALPARSDGTRGTFLLKREDLSPIHSYKWRGAANRLSVLSAAGGVESVVAASAGNHAQGVALAASRLGMKATIFMPSSTPSLKVREVRRLGGDCVRVITGGDTFDDVRLRAEEEAAAVNAVLVPPYDDVHVIAGQGTIGDEIVSSSSRPSTVYLQIGGGGMAAGVACVLRAFYPGTRIVGVEGEGQASMRAAVEAGRPVELDSLDGFCDGTAVRRVGDITYPLCADLIDEYVTVSNDEVCGAIRYLWEARRLVPEPSGAIGVAALLRDHASGKLEPGSSLALLSGANTDFSTLAWISRHARIGMHERIHVRFHIDERAGSLVELLDDVAGDVNICDFQYGKTDSEEAWPVIGFEADSASLDALRDRMRSRGVSFEDVTNAETVDFRLIPMHPSLFRHPLLTVIDFPDRPGALLEFMRRMSDVASICYFNYATTGQTEGHAMIGFEFACAEDRERFRERLARGEAGSGVQYHEIALSNVTTRSGGQTMAVSESRKATP